MPLRRPLSIAVGVTALVALLSYVLPDPWQSTGVGFCLLLGTHQLVLRRDAETIRHHGLGLGGIFEPVPLDTRRIMGAIGKSLAWSGLAALILFPAFWLGFVAWWKPAREFAWPPPPAFESLLTQVLGIAMPEEMFYRGYVQTALDDASKWRVVVLGAEVGAGILLGSVVFALGHLATTGHVARLSVFFPSLVFGWLRAKTRGIGAAVAFHAACNIFSAYLTQAYFSG
jgi:membrane protease YdiL (CAAX protease family)